MSNRRIYETVGIRYADINAMGSIGSAQDSSSETTHYIINDYWYTEDMIEEFGSVSTNIHRVNARLALTVQLLSNSLDEGQIVDLYHDLINMEGYYSVQDYYGAPGELVERDH